MQTIPSTTLLEAVEEVGDFEIQSRRYRDPLSAITLREFGTYLVEDAPRSVPRSALPADHRKALTDIVDRFGGRIAKRGRKAVDRHGAAEPPEWLENLNERENIMTDPTDDTVLAEAYFGLFGADPYGPSPPTGPDREKIREADEEGGEALEEAYDALFGPADPYADD